MCLLATSANAEPRVFVEGGVVIGAQGGLQPKTGTNVGGEVAVGVTVVPYVSLLAGYRNMGDLGSIAGDPNTLNNHPETFSYAAWKLGARFAYPVLPELLGFGELAFVYGVTQIDDVDFAGGDPLVYGRSGIGARVGVIGQTDARRLGASLGVGVAVSYQAFPHDPCAPSSDDCLSSWMTFEVFARVAY